MCNGAVGVLGIFVGSRSLKRASADRMALHVAGALAALEGTCIPQHLSRLVEPLLDELFLSVGSHLCAAIDSFGFDPFFLLCCGPGQSPLVRKETAWGEMNPKDVD